MISEILAGKALELVLRGGKGAVDGLVKLDPPKRLLAILHEQYGEQAGLSRKDFFAWLEVDELGDAVLAVLGGHLLDSDGLLEELIAARLQTKSEEEKSKLAREIARDMVRLAPWAQQELGEAVAHLSHKMDRQHEKLLETIGTRPSVEGGPSSAAEALLRGPLVQIDREDDARRAQQLSEAGEPVAAADVLIDIVTSLREAGLGVAAETYLRLAGDLYAEAGETEAAIQALSQIAEAQVSRGTSAARLSVNKLREALPTERQWEADALEARIGFGEDPTSSLEALRTAVEQSRGTKKAISHLADYTDLLAFTSQFETVLAATTGLAVSEPTDEAELRIFLNRLDALDAVASPEADAGWASLLLALDHRPQPLWAGFAWQRRGASFARAGDVDRCQDAYRRAIAAFSQVAGYQEQAADAFYSLQLGVIMNAAGIPEMELRALAYEQRGSPEAPVARADRLARQGMDYRIADKLPDALCHYMLALELHRRSGSLQGQLEVSEKLGELFLEADRPALAVGFYIAAGKSKEASAAAKQAASLEITSALQPGGSRWERAATLAVLAEIGERLPAEFLAEVGPWVIAEAERDPDGAHAPQPAYHARLALSAILLGLPEDQRDKAVVQVTTDLTRGPFDTIQAAGRALTHATSLDLVDATKPLVEAFLADPYNSRIPIEFLAERVKVDKWARSELEAAATASSPALAVLSLAELVAGNKQLEEAAERAAQSLTEAVNVERTKDGISVSGGRNFAQEAIAAHYASEGGRRAAIERLLEIANDPADSELNRYGAVNALFNLAEAMPDDLAETLVERLLPAALGEYPLSQWDRNIEDRLSRVTISVHTPAALHSGAIETMGRVLRTHPNLPNHPLAEATAVAYRRGPAIAIAAATDALAQVTDIDVPVPVEALLLHSDPAVRLAALRCWKAREDGLPPEHVVVALKSDDNVAIRHSLLLLAGEVGETALLKELAANDEHAMIRRLAERQAEEA